MKRAIFDIETNGLLDTCDTLWCIVLIDVESGDIHRFDPEDCKDGVRMLMQYDEIIGHNIIGFDIPALVKLGLADYDRLPKVTDTLILSRLMHTNIGDVDREHLVKNKDYIPLRLQGSHGLKAWGYRLGEHKGEFGEEEGFDVYKSDMLNYCRQDTIVTHKLYQSLMDQGWDDKCIELEHEFAWCIHRMEQHGFSFDVNKAQKLYVDLSARKLELTEELKVIFPDDKIPMKSHLYRTPNGHLWPTKKAAKEGGFKDKEITKGPHKLKLVPFNPASRDHIGDRLQRLGWKPTDFTEQGKPKIDEGILSKIKLETNQQSVELLNEYLLLVKRMGQLAEGQQAWLKLEKKGRMHGRVNTNGAVTGRCTHSNPNVAQVPRVGSPYGKECRSLFKASEGMKLIGCDAAGLELRCLAHYLAPYDDGDYTRKLLEEDIHTVNQTAAGLPSRDAAKRFIYAFLYGAGDAKIGEVIGKGRGAGKKIKEKFLKSLPALGQLKSCISNALESRNFLKGLDGRHLFIRSEHSALNTLLQSAGAVIMKQATVHLYNSLTSKGLVHGKDWGIVAHVHDEYQCEATPEWSGLVASEAVSAIKQSGVTLGFRCPLDGESKVGFNWAETH